MSEETCICGGYTHGPNDPPDRWVRDRWTATEWTIAYPQPRTCTGCGGIHADDVIQMLRDGWTDEPTTKGYKGYMHAPGFRAELVAYHKSIDKAAMKANPDAACPTCALEGTGDSIVGKIPYPKDPISGPPLKFYLWHFTTEQRDELVKRSMETRKNMPAPWER